MLPDRRLRFLVLLSIVLIALPSATYAVPPGLPPQPTSEQALLDELARTTQGHVHVAYHAATGKLRFIGTAKDYPVEHPPGLAAAASSSEVALAYLDRYGPLFGLDSARRDLHAYRVTTLGDGRHVLRFQQQYQGLPVIAGQLNVQLTKNQALLAITGEVLPVTNLDPVPAVSADQAAASARALVATRYALRASDLTLSQPELALYNPLLLGAPGPHVTSLVWRIEVRAAPTQPIRELVLVSAADGAILLHFNQIATAKERYVCDDNNQGMLFSCDPGNAVRSEGDPPSAIADVNSAYDYTGQTYDFYQSFFGRDSIDGMGMPLVSLVRACPDPALCPLENASWGGAQMTFGAGFAVNDVTAHELTHGVTEFTSNLFYYAQSGALNESLSDIFGEFVDQLYSTNTPAERWLVGEDLPIDLHRNMRDPALFGDPDRMGSPLYVGLIYDNGGVHSNSGVGNKSAYLMTDGATFNGFTITGLGITKTAHIYYDAATTMLTSGSDYADFATALRQSCASLTGSFEISAADCAEVNKVLLATEMDAAPLSAPAPDVPVCRPGQTVNDLFYDPITPNSSNWVPISISGPNSWQTALNLYATSGLYSMHTPGPGINSDSFVLLVNPVTLPANAYLHFAHSYRFETTRAPVLANDGAVVEYSTDAGASWHDAGPLFTAQGYNGSITSPSSPLFGRTAFTGSSHGYRSSRLNLSSLAGSSALLRFRMATDARGASDGWYIDDVRIYTCEGAGPRSQPTALHLRDLTIVQGAGPSSAVVGLASDAEQLAGSLQVEASGAPADMSLSLANTAGQISAQVACACTLSPGSYPLTLTVTNSAQLTATTVFTVHVVPSGTVVHNPSFEHFGRGWHGASTSYALLTPDLPFCTQALCGDSAAPHAGSDWVLLGGHPGMPDTSSVSQTLTLTESSATLSFYLHIPQHSGNGSSDYLEVLIDSTQVFSVTDSATAYDAAYVPVALDLDQLTPGSHTLLVRSHNAPAPTPVRFSLDDLFVVTRPSPCSSQTLTKQFYLPLVLH